MICAAGWLALSAIGCARFEPPVTAPPSASPALSADALGRQILVTFEQPPPVALRGAGSSSRQYVGSPSYARTERTRRLAARLAREYGLRQVDGWPIRPLGVYCVVYQVPDDRSLGDVVEQLAGDERVESAQPMQRFEVLGARRSTEYDDPYVDLQHGLDAMRVFDVHRWAGGRGVTLAVVDTGVDRAHPDLAASLALVKDFVDEDAPAGAAPEWHGTAVAGVIAAAAGNGIGTVGVAPAARLLALRACWESASPGRGSCSTFTLAKALAFVVEQRPEILNLSLGGPSDPLLERLLHLALEAGVAVVAAHEQLDGALTFPGSVEGVIVVRSNGEAPDEAVPGLRDPPSTLTAPGQDILAALPGGRYDFVSGSSFAAAHVSGVAALLLELVPELGGSRLSELLRRTSKTVAGPGGQAIPLIDACAALDGATSTAHCALDPVQADL